MYTLQNEERIAELTGSGVFLTNKRVFQIGKQFSGVFIENISLVRYQTVDRPEFFANALLSLVLAVAAYFIYLYAAIGLGLVFIYFIYRYFSTKRTEVTIGSNGEQSIVTIVGGIKKKEVLKFLQMVEEKI